MKGVAEDPGACLDKPAAREQKAPSLNDNEPGARPAEQVEAEEPDLFITDFREMPVTQREGTCSTCSIHFGVFHNLDT